MQALTGSLLYPSVHQTDEEPEEGPLPTGPSSASQVHPRFRLWFIARGYRPLSIPRMFTIVAQLDH